MSGSAISWAICKSEHRSRQITMPAPHHSVFYRPDALPAAQPIVSKHWRNKMTDKRISNKMPQKIASSFITWRHCTQSFILPSYSSLMMFDWLVFCHVSSRASNIARHSSCTSCCCHAVIHKHTLTTCISLFWQPFSRCNGLANPFWFSSSICSKKTQRKAKENLQRGCR